MHALDTALRDRFELIELPHADGAPSFAQAVAEGLSLSAKRLEAKYLYDDVGSALFEAITLLPEYYLTRAETEILREWGWQIVRVLDAPLDFLELGSGSAVKTRLLIEEALRVQSTLRYSPIDISTQALRAASLALVEAYPRLSVRAYAGDYFDVLRSKSLQLGRRALAMFMGSNIGNYEPAEAARILALIAGALRPGDGLLLGADLKKDPAVLELAYDDPQGVTAAFNRNVLARINRELHADFDVRAFEHVARYDPQRGCVDSFLEARKAMRVQLRDAGTTVDFAAGERIHTESAYKFDAASVAELARAAGFELAQTWQDRQRRFGVNLLVRR
jgi:L-histidine N-alpha-methyltransferase